jgi:hypothetical protein
MDAPPPRKKQRIAVKGKQPDARRSLAPSPDPFGHAVNVSQPLPLPPQARAPPTFQLQGELQPLLRTALSQPLLPVQPSQRTHGHLETGIGNSMADDREFLMTLRDRLILIAKGHSLRDVSSFSQMSGVHEALLIPTLPGPPTAPADMESPLGSKTV